MELCREYTSDLAVLCAALLHDVLEDTQVGKEELVLFLQTVMDEKKVRQTLQLVLDLTDVYVKEAYPQYNRRKRKELERERVASAGADSQTIKYADIIDNCREIVSHDPHFAKVFLGECRKLLEKADRGNQELYLRAKKQLGEAYLSLSA
jgi:(p)ppGpp synthase/HD superfamily hydrolase